MSSPPYGSPNPYGPGTEPPAPARARRRTGAWVAAGTVSLVLLGLVALVGVRAMQEPEMAGAPSRGTASTPASGPAASSARSPRPSATRPSSAPAAPKPKVKVKAPAPAAPRSTGLRDNSLYAVDLAAGAGRCDLRVRPAKPPLPNSRLGPYLRTVVDCLVGVFREPLKQVGIPLSTPKVKTFKKSISTPCGKLDREGSPAYYCPVSQTIYWPTRSDDGREAYTFARLGYVGLTAHEFGHHLQTVSGIAEDYLERYDDAGRRERYLLSRRLELQAQCFEGLFLRHAERAVRLTRRDREELAEWHSFTGDEDPPSSRRPDHGSSRAQIFWLRRGLAGADFGRCNTWSAPKRLVR